MEFFKKVPVPMAGVALAMFTLGNIYKDTHPQLRLAFGVVALVIWMLVLLKAIVATDSVKKEYRNPLVASVAPTFSMATMVLATYVVPFSATIAAIVWFIGVVLHVVLMLSYVQSVLVPFDIKKIFVSLFVPFVGIVVASVTAPALGQHAIGQVCFWFGLIIFVPILAIVLYRLLVVRNIPAPARPSVAILAAPAALLLAGYLQSFDQKSAGLVLTLGSVAFVLWLLGLVLTVPTLRSSFSPSYAAYTFPLAISAVAFGGLAKFFAKTGLVCPAVPLIARIALWVAWAAILYVSARYALFLCARKKD